MCGELARAIPADGEGATHLITLDVTGCATTAAARQIAKTVADSPLVKTAVAGADPNWGRIVSAAGYAGVAFDPAGVDLTHQRLSALRARRAGRVRRRRRSRPRSATTATRAVVLQFWRRGRADPLLDDRSDGRIRAAERRLSHLAAVDCARPQTLRARPASADPAGGAPTAGPSPALDTGLRLIGNGS